MDPFEKHKQEIYQPPPVQDGFPDFNARWIPEFDEGIKTKTGKGLEQGADIFKKAVTFCVCWLGLVALIITLPPIIRFLIEFSSWAFDAAGNIFP